jgi:hypothetical protein
LLGAAAGGVLLAGGVGAAFAVQPEQQPAPAPRESTQLVTIFDAPPLPEPTPTTTTSAPRLPTPSPVAPAQASGGSSATISVVIPARTFVHLDGDRRPVEAMTNTGHHPQPTDQFCVEENGTNTPASAAVARTVVAESGSGDWSTPGAWHQLPS